MMRPIFVVAFLSVLFTTSIATNCCPPRRTANNDQFLQLQQTFGTGIICTYGCGPNFRQCLYDASGNRLTTDNGCADTTVQDTFDAPYCPPTSVIHPNYDPNKCVEVKDANYADGTPVQINQCSGQNNQKFIFNPDFTTLIRVAGTDFCLAAGNPAAGSTVRLRKCDRTSGEQIWVYETFSKRFLLYITYPSPDLVLNLPNAQNGQQLNILVRDPNDKKQVFTLDP